MDELSAGRPGHDGTQPPPPPPLFADPLAGLVTGEQRYRPPEAVVPVVPPPPGPVDVPPTRAAARRPAQPSSRPVRAPVRQERGQPAEPVRRAPGRVVVEQGPKKSRAGLIGCLVALATLSGLLFTVVREIIGAVVDLLR
ncbi:hypothetical protein LZG04_33015 [Saccharothrix sp. S26]|uniref:hypothetical protein n=1 Tax=Saccharothrix sp. S26 TaxID=2907215 RepID=UPI001F30B51C|nr:hypothetical protein [Saccharothrix sp. S26]MCE6999599.1 hypothetical protein [Saccharothrix sp. S26]